MTAGLNRQTHPELAARLRPSIASCSARWSRPTSITTKKLAEALRILAIERDTWRAVCARLKGIAAAADAPPPHFSPQIDSAAPSGFSLEA